MRLAFTPDGKYFGAGLGANTEALEGHLPELIGPRRTAIRTEGVAGADVWEVSPPLPAHMIAHTGKLALEYLQYVQVAGDGPEDRDGSVVVVSDFEDLGRDLVAVATFTDYGNVVLHEAVLSEFAEAA